MQLRTARLCLDCEEIHDAQRCPACASETFAFISRWVPAPQGDKGDSPPGSSPAREAAVYRELLAPETRRPRTGRWLGRGALGLATVGVVGWWWRHRNNQPPPKPGPDGANQPDPNA